MSRWITVLALMLASISAEAQTNPASQAARQWRQQHERAIVDEYIQLLSIPNVASDSSNIQRNVDLLSKMMQARGIATKVLKTSGANPVVYGEMTTPGATRTVVFYAHYDGQPVSPTEWSTPPFSPALRSGPVQKGGTVVPLPAPGTAFEPESRLYGRSSGDDKAPIMAMLSALDAIHASAVKTHSTLRFVFEGEEEAGSTNLATILSENKALVTGDVWLLCDGPTHPSRRQQIIFGAPGRVAFDLTVYGANSDLHGGHYGNWAPNPAFMLARLLTSMRDDNGHVLIPHFYDDVEPLTPTEKRALAEVPDVDAQLMEEFGLGARSGKPMSLAELLTLPVLNLKGFLSARVGAEAANLVPTSATAALHLQPVKGMDYHKSLEQTRQHIQAQGYFVTDTAPSLQVRMAHEKVAMLAMRGGAYNGTRTSMELPVSREVVRAAESANGPVIKLPTMGGAIPLEMIERITGAPTIVVPIANHDDNQHGFDENLRIKNLWDGIELMAALLTI